MSMREIKFRAFHKATKTMIVPVGVLPLGGCLELTLERKVGNAGSTEKNYTYYNADQIDIMQSTGLLDKNGKEIYEGDIIRDSDGSAEVKWSQEDCGFIAWYNQFNILNFPKDVEIIGNIYENPELTANPRGEEGDDK